MMRADRERGFTLLEVLVALVMAALLGAILLDGASMARTRTARAAQQQRAVFLARDLITRAAVAKYGAIVPEGTTNGLDWRVVETVALADPRGLSALVELRATVLDRHGAALFTADTRRLKTLTRQ